MGVYRACCSLAVYETLVRLYMGGCQDYGPFLGPCYNTAPII